MTPLQAAYLKDKERKRRRETGHIDQKTITAKIKEYEREQIITYTRSRNPKDNQHRNAVGGEGCAIHLGDVSENKRNEEKSTVSLPKQCKTMD